MTEDRKMQVLILLSFLALAHCTVSGPTSANEENGIGPDGRQRGAVGSGVVHGESDEANATAAVGRTGRQYGYGYRPSAAGFAYLQPYPQRRAYKGPPHPKKRPPSRSKPPGRRPRPRRRPAAVHPPPMSRFRRPAALRPLQQHTNYVDSPPLDYVDDGFESSVPFDYGEREFDLQHEPYAMQYDSAAGGASLPPLAAMVRSRKRPAGLAAADEPQATTIVHVPVRVHARPVVAATPAPPTADPMEKLRQMVQEAMDEHFASRHQELYADGFGKERVHGQQVQQQYSAKYKRQQQTAADKDKLQRSAAEDDENVAAAAASSSSPRSAKKGVDDATPYTSAADADADGSDNRPLTLAEISAYMGSKPAETVLQAGGHRYLLSDALQHTYRQQQQQQQQQQAHHQQYDVEDHHSLHRGQQYLRYVSPFEAIYELPAGRWTYK